VPRPSPYSALALAFLSHLVTRSLLFPHSPHHIGSNQPDVHPCPIFSRRLRELLLQREVLEKFVNFSVPDPFSSLMQSPIGRWEAGKKKLAPATASASHGVVVLVGVYLHAKIQGEGRARPVRLSRKGVYEVGTSTNLRLSFVPCRYRHCAFYTNGAR
jgi:hypothetical protein